MTEDPAAGYQASPWGGDCNQDGTIVLDDGDDAVCSILNDDVGPTTSPVLQLEWNLLDSQRVYGLTVDSVGFVYAADYVGNEISKYDGGGNFVLRWGSTGTGIGEFDSVVGIEVSPDGFLYAADIENQRVQKFDTDGNYVTSWSGPDSDFYANDVAVSDSGQVYSVYGTRVVVFDDVGTVIDQWTVPSCEAAGITVDSSGFVYVCDFCLASPEHAGPQIYKFSPNGDLVMTWVVEEADFLLDIEADGEGSVYVANGSRVHKYGDNGVFLVSFPLGEVDGMIGVAVSADAQDVFVAIDAGGVPAIQKYSY